MGTFLTGLLTLAIYGHQGGGEMFHSSFGVCILTGAALGTLMWANVWFVIWPNQKVVIASATQAATGGKALPEAAAAGARATVASRTNVLFSIPMLFFMGAARHLPLTLHDQPQYCVAAIVIGLILLALEANALKGKTGPMTTIKGVVHCGFALAVVLYLVVEAFV